MSSEPAPWLVVLFALVFVHCGGSKKESSTLPKAMPEAAPEPNVAPPKPMSPPVARTRAFADQMCECKELGCVSRVQSKMGEWARSQPKEPSDDDAAAMEEDLRRITRCASSIESSASPAENEVGVHECDEFLRKYLRCIRESPKVPDDVRQQVEDAMSQVRKTWRDEITKDPSQRAPLAEACMEAADAVKETTFNSFDCEW